MENDGLNNDGKTLPLLLLYLPPEPAVLLSSAPLCELTGRSALKLSSENLPQAPSATPGVSSLGWDLKWSEPHLAACGTLGRKAPLQEAFAAQSSPSSRRSPGWNPPLTPQSWTLLRACLGHPEGQDQGAQPCHPEEVSAGSQHRAARPSNSALGRLGPSTVLAGMWPQCPTSDPACNCLCSELPGGQA